MESLMKKDLVEVINRQRSGTLDCLLYTSDAADE